MLQVLRNKSQSIFIQIIVVIIALVFIFWGVGTNLFSSGESALVVNGEKISFQDFQQTYDRAYNNMRDRFGGNIPQGLLEKLGIKEQVVNQLVQDTLIRQGAAEMGIRVSREEVRKAIQEMRQFYKEDAFNIEQYNTILAANHLSPTKFEEMVALDLLKEKAISSIAGFASTATNEEIEDVYSLDKSTVAFDYISFSDTDYRDAVAMNEEKITSWFETVKDNYKTDPKIKLSYLDFNFEDIGKKISIDEPEITSYYDNNIDAFSDKEERHARHILFKANENDTEATHAEKRAKAEEILALAKEGADFSELAKQHSEGPSKSSGGDLGYFPRGRMIKPFEDAVFTLEKGEISDIVKTSYGYHIIKVEDIKEAQTKPLKEVRDEIVSILQIEQAKPLAFQLASEAYESIIGAGSLKAYLEDRKNSVDLKKTAFFDEKHPPKEIGRDRKFLSAAFSLKEKELSSIVETDKGYAILYVDELQPPQVPDITTIKKQVDKDYRNHQAKELAKTDATALLDAVKTGKSLKETAGEKGLSLNSSGYLEKNGAEQKIPQIVIDKAFTLSPSNSFPEEPLEYNNTYYIIQFTGRKAPETELNEEEIATYRDSIISSKEEQVVTAWINNMRDNAEILRHKNL